MDGAGFAVHKMGDAFLDDPAPVDFGVAVVVAHIMGEHFVVVVFIADKGYLAIGDAFGAVAVQFHCLLAVQMVNGMELGEVIGKDFFDLCVALSMGEQFIADIGNDFRVFGKKRHLFGDFLFVSEVGEVIDEVFQFKAVLNVLQVHGCFLWVGMKLVKGGDGFFDKPAIAVFAESDSLL